MRLMAGDLTPPAQRYLARLQRKMEREQHQLQEMMQWVDRIKRREQGADDLPPMPLNFTEIERRRKRDQR
jgi:hypothetical protein